VAGWPQPIPVRHATDCVGRPMVLARVGSDIARALGAVDARSRVAAMLSVEDHEPSSLGRVKVGGWVHRLDADEVGPARLEFAEANPVADLLDVGAGVTMYAVEVDRVELQRNAMTVDIDVDAFIAADPNPLLLPH
jgi:hypothetical protein